MVTVCPPYLGARPHSSGAGCYKQAIPQRISHRALCTWLEGWAAPQSTFSFLGGKFRRRSVKRPEKLDRDGTGLGCAVKLRAYAGGRSRRCSTPSPPRKEKVDGRSAHPYHQARGRISCTRDSLWGLSYLYNSYHATGSSSLWAAPQKPATIALRPCRSGHRPDVELPRTATVAVVCHLSAHFLLVVLARRLYGTATSMLGKSSPETEVSELALRLHSMEPKSSPETEVSELASRLHSVEPKSSPETEVSELASRLHSVEPKS